MEKATQMKGRVANKEEMMRKLQEMRQKYDKMQRKLLKSERRRNARNHVRKVLAEQANATSPHFSHSKISNTCESTTSVAGDVLHNSVEDEEHSENGRSREGKKETLQKSISFKLEERVLENEKQTNKFDRDAKCGKRSRRVGPKQVEVNLTTCLQRDETVYDVRCKKDQETVGLFEEIRLPDCKTSKPTRTGDEGCNFTDAYGQSKSLTEQAFVASESAIQQDTTDGESQAFIRSPQRDCIKEDPESASTVSENGVSDRVTLRWKGMFMKQDLTRGVAWDGAFLHQLGSLLLLVLYHSHLAVLWVYTEHWEARQQWEPEEGKEINNVVLGGEAVQDVTLLFLMKDEQNNILRILKCNLESGSEVAEDVHLCDSLREAEELRIILHRGGGGVTMQKTSTILTDFFFFQYEYDQPFQMWQPDELNTMSAVSFIPVTSSPNLFLCLSSNTLSLWMPASRTSLVEVVLDKMANVEVNELHWAETEGGLLFFIGLKHPSTLSLYAINPATTTVLQIHKFLQPCAYDSQRVMDTSINGQFLVVLYSSKKLLIWDIYSGRALAELSPPDDEIRHLTGVSNFFILNGKDTSLFEYAPVH